MESKSRPRNPSKLGKFVAGVAIFCRDSELTEESLEAHNKRIREMEEKIPKSSPYYRGLTDSSLATSATATNSSLSSFVDKVRECLGKNKNKNFDPEKSANPAGKIETEASTSRALASETMTEMTNETRKKDEEFPEKEMEKREAAMWVKEREKKVLRERLNSGRDGGEVVVENERERFTWGDRYRPELLEHFICNSKKALQLKKEVKERGYCEHYIFEGPPGVGKRTMIQALLREIFGNKAMEVYDQITFLNCQIYSALAALFQRPPIKEVIKVFDLKSEMVGSMKVKMKESFHHVEVNLSQTKGYEKQVIVQLIKQTQCPFPCDGSNCRGIMLCEADKLSNETLMYVKWVIERYKGCNKIFFCCSDISKLQPVMSLCNIVQLLPPSKDEIVEVLEFIAKQEGFDLSTRMAARIADNSNNNLRQAVRSLEASWDKSQSFQEDEEQLLTGWEDDIADVAKKIVQEQSPKQLYIVRGKLKKLIEHDVSPNFIFKTLVDELKNLLDKELQQRIECLNEDYNINEEKAFVTEKVYGEEGSEEMASRLHDPMRKNFHHFLKIEEFIAKFMSCYKAEASRKNELPRRNTQLNS